MNKSKIGLRTVKTAIAVALCFLIEYLLNIAFNRNDFPYFSATAAIFCMQKNLESSKSISFSRIIGTVIGGIYGLLLLWIIHFVLSRPPMWAEYAIIAVGIIPLIQITVILKIPLATYIACAVCLGVLLTYTNSENPLLYAGKRVLETVMGILLSLGVNALPFLNTKVSED
ncbi:MAG: aromatic acid exporter family protein [Oscillospiraceae bacterium]|jgi:uncharacterized membrane protein YgaE (UPF0421/DUF939 family)|nr:aromatic acid exporter family protein [Oscillospiraceae bacterium]